MKLSITSGIQDTRDNCEDFAITPYLFFVKPFPNKYKTYGIGLCWFWFAVFIGLTFNTPKQLGRFLWLNKL